MSKIEKLRKIVEEQNAGRVDGVFVDMFSASAILRVYDAINETNQVKFASHPIGRMNDIAFSILNKAK